MKAEVWYKNIGNGNVLLATELWNKGIIVNKLEIMKYKNADIDTVETKMVKHRIKALHYYMFRSIRGNIYTYKEIKKIRIFNFWDNVQITTVVMTNYIAYFLFYFSRSTPLQSFTTVSYTHLLPFLKEYGSKKRY